MNKNLTLNESLKYAKKMKKTVLMILHLILIYK